MLVIQGHRAIARPRDQGVVTVGNFDGVHRGHQAIIKLAVDKARARGGEAVAYTFRPHPHVMLRPEAGVQLLSTYDEKLQLLEALGVDVTVEEPFSREFSTIDPAVFFSDILLRRLNASEVVVGYDFAFGKERSGHLSLLRECCAGAGVELTVVPAQRASQPGGQPDGEVVSSSRIRQLLLGGEIARATQLLGREFSYRGVVIRGEGRGRKIGFPTANLELPDSRDKLAMPYGVYATWATLDGRRLPSVTNVGVRPTFQQGPKTLPALVETHLIGETIDLYGRVLEVGFVSKLRDERKFSGPSFMDDLKAQIALDAAAATGALAVG